MYTAPTEAAALERFLGFQEHWDAKYPAIVRLWENVWAEFVLFLAFDAEIRRIVRSTNAIVILSFDLTQVSELGGGVEDIVLDTAGVLACV